MDRFNGRHALITGGASGIGRATGIRFLWESARVSIIDKAFPGSTASLADEAEVPEDCATFFRRMSPNWKICGLQSKMRLTCPEN